MGFIKIYMTTYNVYGENVKALCWLVILIGTSPSEGKYQNNAMLVKFWLF